MIEPGFHYCHFPEMPMTLRWCFRRSFPSMESSPIID